MEQLTLGAGYPSAGRAGYVLILLAISCIAATLNLQAYSVLVTPVKQALGLSDSQVGLLQGVAFFSTLGLVSIPIGALIDRVSRVRFFSLIAVGWGAFTALSAFASNFGELFACRVGVGISEAGMYTAAYSLIADLYPPARRAAGMFVFYGVVLLGAGIASFSVGSLVAWLDAHPFGLTWGHDLASWRLTLLMISLPAPVLACLFLLTTEPSRQREQGSEPNSSDDKSLSAYIHQHWRLLFRICGSMLIAMMGFQAFYLWMPTIVMTEYGASTSMSGQLFGLGFGGGSIFGVIFAAALSECLRRRGPQTAAFSGLRVGIWGSVLILPLMLFARNIYESVAVWFLFNALTYVAQPNGPNLINIITPSHLRGRVLAIYNLSLIFAATISPTVVGILSDHVFRSASGLLWSCCAIGIPGAVIAALLLETKRI